METEPVKERGVLSRGHSARQGLVKVMVGIDQAWQNHHITGINNRIRRVGKRLGWPDLPNDTIDHVDPAIRPAPLLIIHRNKQSSVLKQTGSHITLFPLEAASYNQQHCFVKSTNARHAAYT